MTVLVVEDDADQLSIRSLLLQRHGYRVLEADNVDTALQAAEAGSPEYAVLDLGLPTIADGLRLIRELKSRSPTLTLLVLTGHLHPNHPELALAAAVLAKGNASGALLTKLDELTKCSSAAPETRSRR